MFPLLAAKYGYGKDAEYAEQANTANIIFMGLVQACFNVSGYTPHAFLIMMICMALCAHQVKCIRL